MPFAVRSAGLARRLAWLLPMAMTVLLAAAAAPTPRPPSLLFITVDTLRADRLECYGYRQVKTPRINALAADGILVENAFTPVPVTLPSHASLFTGTYPWFHGVRDFTGSALGPERTTLAELLLAAGYRTGAVIGAAVLEARWGLDQGFSFYSDYFPPQPDRNWQQIAERRGDQVVRESLEWIEKNRQVPFFLWVHLYDPHDPYTPPAPYDGLYGSRPYDGEVAWTDECVGRLLDGLKKSGLYESSLIVLVSDHGEGLGEHGEETHGYFLYDSTLRIPLIFKLPGTDAPRARRVSGPLETVDVLPTVIDILGINGKTAAPEIQGRSALALLLGQAPPSEKPSLAEIMLPFYQFDYSPLSSLRTGRFKYIEAPKPELYDTAADPGEKNNLTGSVPDQAAGMKEALRRQMERTAAKKGQVAAPRITDSAMAEKLASLGYLAHHRKAAEPAPGSRLPDPKDRVGVYDLIFRGTYAARMGRLGKAAPLLREAVAREPDSFVGHFQLGVIYLASRNVREAEEEFQKTLELRPGNELSLLRLAEVYTAAGRFAEAETAYRKAILLSPKDYMIHFNLGGLYVTQDKWDEALAAFRKAQALSSRDVLVPVVIARVLLQKGDLPGALAAAGQALRLDPSLAAAHETALEIYQKMGKVAEAKKEEQILRRLQAGP